MKTKRFLLLFGVSLFFCFPSSVEGEKVNQSGEFVTVGEVTSPWLKQLAGHGTGKYHASSMNKQKAKAVLLDGRHLTSHIIRKNNTVKQAIKHNIPIVIDKPGDGQVHAIMGAEIDADAMIIVPKVGRDRGKDGRVYAFQEFEVYLMDEPKMSDSFHASWIGVGPGPGGYWGNGPIGRVINIIDNSVVRNENEIGEFINDNIGCHRRWTVTPVSPFIWEKQGAMIDIGFVYDLYYVVSPEPVRKYLTVKTMGKGATPGKLKADHIFHRGYYQNALTVRIEHVQSDGWKGTPLKIEDLAPRSDNNTGQVQVATGKQFRIGALMGGVNTNAGVDMGFSFYTQETQVREYRDFTVSQDGEPNVAQWTYWMSSASGAALRRGNQAGDLLSHARGIAMIRDLPELATGSYLKPYLEVVYFADGDEIGKQVMRATVTQYLQDFKNGIVSTGVRNKVGVLTQHFSVDFSKVDAACEG